MPKTVGIARLRTGLMRELDTLLAVAAFHRVRDRFYGDRYCRESTGVRHGLGIGGRPYIQALEAAVGNVSVRFHNVEALVAKLEDPHPLIDARAIAVRSTLSVQVDESIPGPGDPLRRWGGTARKLWLIRSQEEIPGAAAQIAAFAIEKGEPIFATLSDPERALEILSRDDEEARSYSGPDEVRAMKAITFAFVLHGESAAKQLAEAKLSRMRGEAVGALSRFIKRLA